MALEEVPLEVAAAAAAALAANQEDAVPHHHPDLDHHGHALLRLDLGLGRLIQCPSQGRPHLLIHRVHL